MATGMVSRIFSFIIFCALIATGCGDRKKNQVSDKTGTIQTGTIEPGISGGMSLDGWEITNFGPQGPVSLSGDGIILGMGDGCTGITWKGDFPETDYEVTLDAKRVAGNDFFCGITFPAGKDPCTLIIGGWGGTICGLSCINGKDASENETTSLRKFEKDRWYNIRLRVTGKDIITWIDEEQVVSFTIGDKKLSIRPEVELSRPFGIASWKTTAAIKNIKMKKL